MNRKVVRLYALLLRDFGNLPDVSDPGWMDFGFCFAPSECWKRQMSDKYLELALCTSLDEIVTCWEENYQLDGLFKTKEIDLSAFHQVEISFGRPKQMQMGVFQLMIEINHVHRGIFCQCAEERGCRCKTSSGFEPRFSPESVFDYGFDKLNPWERWQIMNLWRDVFASPKFDPRDLMQARRSTDDSTFRSYIDGLVDTSVYWNRYKAGMPFPNFYGRINWDGSSIPMCYCICQQVVSQGPNRFTKNHNLCLPSRSNKTWANFPTRSSASLGPRARR